MTSEKTRKNNYLLAQSTMDEEESSCNYCGYIWTQQTVQEGTAPVRSVTCPNCRRNPANVYPFAPLGDVPLARVKMAQKLSKERLERANNFMKAQSEPAVAKSRK